jgi:hypothetical protein
MIESNPFTAELSALAAYLAARREQILETWLLSVASDSQLTTPAGLSRTQFNDHIPQVLDAFDRRLQAADGADKVQAHIEEKQSAGEHGLHRWQQGYNQGDTIREWGHLHYALLTELENFSRENPQLPHEVMPIARRALVRRATSACSAARPPAGYASWKPRSSRCSCWTGSGPRAGARPRTTCAAPSASLPTPPRS